MRSKKRNSRSHLKSWNRLLVIMPWPVLRFMGNTVHSVASIPGRTVISHSIQFHICCPSSASPPQWLLGFNKKIHKYAFERSNQCNNCSSLIADGKDCPNNSCLKTTKCFWQEYQTSKIYISYPRSSENPAGSKFYHHITSAFMPLGPRPVPPSAPVTQKFHAYISPDQYQSVNWS